MQRSGFSERSFAFMASVILEAHKLKKDKKAFLQYAQDIWEIIGKDEGGLTAVLIEEIMMRNLTL